MSLRLKCSSPEELRSLRLRVLDDPLTYQCVGSSLDDDAPIDRGLKRRTWSTSLHGSSAFDAGRNALREWAIHRGAGLSVGAAGPLVVGAVVAMAAPLLVGCVEATCRVIDVLDEPDRFGFAYGTLPVHPERGEESFVLTRQPEGAAFTVRAVSKPVHPLARLAPPVADRLQQRATQRYLRAMADAVT